MTIRDQIQQNMTAALKAGDKPRLEAVRYLFSQIKNREIDLKRPLTDEEAIKLLQTEAKRRKESIAAYQNGGRQDLVEKESYQLSVIEEYLPKQLTDEELKQLIEKVKQTLLPEALAKGGFGTLIRETMKQAAGRADGGRVAELIHSK